MSLITADELRGRLGDPDLRICDVRWWLTDRPKGRRDYAAGHIPGAVFVDLDRDLAAPAGPGRHPLPSPAGFAARMAALGVGERARSSPTTTPVGRSPRACGGCSTTSVTPRPGARRRDRGVDRDRRPADGRGAGPRAGPAHAPRSRGRGRSTARRSRRGWATVGVIDARAPERYRGEVEPDRRLPGHIPGAISRPTAATSARTAGSWIPRRCAAGSRASAAGDVVSYCGSGVTACHNALAMRIAGLPDPIVYSGRTATGRGPAGPSRRATSRDRPSPRSAAGACGRPAAWAIATSSAAANPIARSPEQRDLEPEQADLRPDRDPEPVPDQVERAERGDHRQDVRGKA